MIALIWFHSQNEHTALDHVCILSSLTYSLRAKTCNCMGRTCGLLCTYSTNVATMKNIGKLDNAGLDKRCMKLLQRKK